MNCFEMKRTKNEESKALGKKSFNGMKFQNLKLKMAKTKKSSPDLPKKNSLGGFNSLLTHGVVTSDFLGYINM